MFSKHYQAELAFLRTMGKAFANAHPSVAGLLADRGGDPDVERLLEGFAFLAARVRERLDDSVPEINHDLMEMLVPHYVRPLPACSVVEFTPIQGALRNRAKVPRGTELASSEVEGVACQFRTTSELELVPVTLQDAALDHAIGARPTLRLSFQATAAALPSVFQDEGLRFFIHGDLPLASTLLLWIARYARGVEVRGLGAERRTVTLPPTAIKPIGFSPEFALLPWPERAPAGYRTLQEYFTLPQKFLFFEVTGLSAAQAITDERFEIAITFERPPELPARITRDTFRLHCAPVINLFSTSADPIRVEVLGEEHLVRAGGMEPTHAEVYSVERVEGLPDDRGNRRPYHPFWSFGHGSEGSEARYHRLRRRSAVLDDGIDTYLSIMTPRDGGVGPSEEVLSLELTCTNRSLPAQLKLGEISVPTQTSPTYARFRNILPVTKPVRPPTGSELHWRLVSHLAANRAPLSVETLRTLLDVYNFQALVDQHSGRANRLRIEGIRSVEATAARRILDGAPVRGARVAIELEEAQFAGPGDAFLFAGVIDELLAARIGINSFAELNVKLEPSLREYAWSPRNGRRALL